MTTMTKIGLIDSGVGGQNTLPEDVNFIQKPNDKFISYGSMSDDELLGVFYDHLAYLDNASVDVIYVGCFTLSCFLHNKVLPVKVITLLDIINPSWFDTVIGTPRTCEFFKPTHNTISCPDLSIQIENNQLTVLPDHDKIVESLLIGCSHYYSIKNQIEAKYKPKTIITPKFNVQ